MDPSTRRVLSAVPVLAALIVLAAVPMPMFAIAPGPPSDVLPLIHVSGHRVYPPSGHLLLTTVTLTHATAFDALRGWLDAYIDVLPERQILPPGVSEEEDNQIQLSSMDESKLTAASVALERVTDYPRSHGPGALVRTVTAGSAADGLLFPGDLIVAVDGTAVAAPDDLIARVRTAGSTRTLSLTVRVDRDTRTVRVRPSVPPGGDRPLLGVELLANFPFPVDIDSGDIGGPSAGLMWTVGLIDLLTPGDLTGGRRIAGTGTIEPGGTVGPIGGVGQKVVAAERSGAEVFLVPRADLADARAVGADLRLVPVDALDDALAYLTSTCGCSLP